ncbi:hypothetical protein GUITHDRAFT_111856 [Guillardia theta CCMP2712]|uniref:Uncharacterized protein n=1 Tax=Guillardia theta (strain CCMP2712) TaxID=905079 RepID=L1J106_GUITC|nr:hypothetical protein GUITHDRAFT_111856 [Guillardia theta CCMP2712]EKX42002.1 hypothetical protein GUITHDRAFT_111856 [Guillardia theta CCMP2712]|eukprot:XP_005828982.1 hypothetical protein GUITHDRAFT_111856 [Guillardia theta CCMP2712]
MGTNSVEAGEEEMEGIQDGEHMSMTRMSDQSPALPGDFSFSSPAGCSAVDRSLNDPDGGASVLRRSLDVAEREMSELRKKLKRSQERCEALEREREERYVKMKAEIYENSMSLMREVQKGHNDSQEISARRIAFLERELDAARSDCSNMEMLSRELETKKNECNELQEALEELENEKRVEIAAAVEQACADLRRSLQVADESHGSHEQADKQDTKVDGSLEENMADYHLNQTTQGNKYTDEEFEAMNAQLERVSEDKESLQHRLCDAEEKNKRLERELHRMSDIQRQMEVKFAQVQMEYQIFMEMEARNRQWEEDSSSLYSRDKSKKKNRGSREEGLQRQRAEQDSEMGKSILLLQNDVENLRYQLESRDAELRAVKLQYTNTSSNQADELTSAKKELEQMREKLMLVENSKTLSPSAAATDMSLYRKLRSLEDETRQLEDEKGYLREQLEEERRMRTKTRGELDDQITFYQNLIKNFIILAVNIRKGFYNWSDSSPLVVNGFLNLVISSPLRGRICVELYGRRKLHVETSSDQTFFSGFQYGMCLGDSAQVSVMEGSEIKCEHAIVLGNVSSDAKLVLSKGITLQEELCSPRDLSRLKELISANLMAEEGAWIFEEEGERNLISSMAPVGPFSPILREVEGLRHGDLVACGKDSPGDGRAGQGRAGQGRAGQVMGRDGTGR